MSKQDEKKYYSRLSAEGQRHADGKPYSDAECGQMLMAIGQIITLLPPPPARLLDLGCGTGWTSEFYARTGYAVTGLDISIDMVRAAVRIRSFPSLNFVVADFEQMPVSAAFDAIVSYGALHHAQNLSSALSSCRRALRPNGLMIVMEPGKGHSESETSRRYASEYGLTEQSLPPDLICSALRSSGYEEVKIFPWLGLFSSALTAAPEQKSRKYQLVAQMIGQQLANCIQLYSMTQKCAIVLARRS